MAQGKGAAVIMWPPWAPGSWLLPLLASPGISLTCTRQQPVRSWGPWGWGRHLYQGIQEIRMPRCLPSFCPLLLVTFGLCQSASPSPGVCCLGPAPLKVCQAVHPDL